ncbi:protein PRRC1-like [Macrobrachium rosenbergii]|uniref:protein PRRC1-like n=1 Tax=Macrobrachium rosenbergii TaxID=79674 RepID=UPI0034D5D6E8
MVQVPQQDSRSCHFHRTKRPCPLIKTGIAVPNHARDTEGSCSPGPPSALYDITSLPVPLASTGQCQAPPISGGSSMPILLPMPGPELVPVPDPEPHPDPPTGDPPNLTTMIIAQCEPLTPDVSSSHTLPPAEDDPLVGLDITSFLVDQELSGQDADTGSVPTTVVAAAEVGGQPVTPEAAPDSAPDGAPGCTSESVPSSTPWNGLARHWSPPKKNKKGWKKST